MKRLWSVSISDLQERKTKQTVCAFLFALNALTSQALAQSGSVRTWFKPIGQRLHQIWTEGDTELFISGYAWHNRHTYSAERINTYNEKAWGGGMGKGLFDEKGNWHGLGALVFLDSHKKPEPNLGYTYLKVASIAKDLKAGIGYSLVITQRQDMNHGLPFPGALPWASIFFKKLTLTATYIPGLKKDVGNVLFVYGKYTL